MKILFFSIFIFFNYLSFAQTGNLSGKVTDEAGAIPSANIFIINTKIGAGADANGNYRINNVPVGEYEVRFSAVGYQQKVVDVNILPNKTTELNITCLLYTSPSPRDRTRSRMPSSA